MTNRPRLRAISMATVLTFGLAACGSGNDSAGSCEDLAGEAAVLVEDLIAELDGLSLSDMAAMGDEGPDFMSDFEEEGEALSEEQAELGCSDEQMTELLAAEIDEIEVEPGSMGALLVEAIKTDGLSVAER